MIEFMTPSDILHLSHVDRWHNLRTARPQNLAEHSGRVALIATWLGYQREGGLEPFTPEVALETMLLALTHDVPEIEYGDLPNPTKGALHAATGITYDQIMDRRFWGSRGADGTPWDCSCSLAQRLVRVADALDGACFYWAEGMTRARPGRMDLAEDIVRTAWGVLDRELPDLEEAFSQMLAAAGVPDSLAYRFDPSKA